MLGSVQILYIFYDMDKNEKGKSEGLHKKALDFFVKMG